MDHAVTAADLLAAWAGGVLAGLALDRLVLVPLVDWWYRARRRAG